MSKVCLDCDLGNTRFKWRIQRDGHTLGQGVGRYDSDLGTIAGIGKVDRIRVASVAASSVVDRFIEVVSNGAVLPEIAKSQHQAGGVTNAYGDDYARLGVDRWLAVVAAFNRVRGAVLVIDAGSAITADLVDAGGIHHGGYIAPGSALMRGALSASTGQVKFEFDSQVKGPAFGGSTQSAVDAGVLAAQLGVAKVAVEEAGRRIPEGFAILVTGGDADLLLPYLPGRAEIAPDLVLEGLNWVLP